jgi:predicted metal-dependent hydrolase
MNQKFPCILRISEKAKRVRFEVSTEKGLEIVVPTRFSPSRVPSLVQKNSQWIEGAFQKAKAFQGLIGPMADWHTKHLNHSPRFWRLVESYLPDYRRFHRQLRNGSRWMPGWLTASCGGKSGKLGVGRQANQMQSSAFI